MCQLVGPNWIYYMKRWNVAKFSVRVTVFPHSYHRLSQINYYIFKLLLSTLYQKWNYEFSMTKSVRVYVEFLAHGCAEKLYSYDDNEDNHAFSLNAFWNVFSSDYVHQNANSNVNALNSIIYVCFYLPRSFYRCDERICNRTENKA